MNKAKLYLNIDQDIVNFAEIFAAKNRISIEDMIEQYLLSLKQCIESSDKSPLLFEQAMKEALIKLRTGTAKWHSYEEVFGG
jgi:hypothetical protein